jgi:hypothetical protein
VAVFFGVPKISAIHGPVFGGNAGRSRPEAEETAKALAVPSLFSADPVIRKQPRHLDMPSSDQVALALVAPAKALRHARQQNPHPRRSLACAAWLVARLGGWNGYPSSRPSRPHNPQNRHRQTPIVGAGMGTEKCVHALALFAGATITRCEADFTRRLPLAVPAPTPPGGHPARPGSRRHNGSCAGSPRNCVK